jgi:diguanylate cyclase (GGDEF)-like protein
MLRPRLNYEVPNPAMVRDTHLPLENFEAPAVAGHVAAKKARYLALHDELTLLPNREYFRARLELALERAAPPHQALAVFHLSINLEDFKQSIDAYGGELLRRIAGRLALAPRPEDMLCHLEDDQFACLVPGLSKREQLSDLANRLLDAVPFPLRIGILQLCICPSIGIAIYPADGASAELLLANAQFAMRRAKRRDAGFTFADEG